MFLYKNQNMVEGMGFLLEPMEGMGRLGWKRGQLTVPRVQICSLQLEISRVEQASFQ